MLNKFSKSEQILIFTELILVLIVLVIIEGWFVAYLWNWLMPIIFGLTTITLWQGVGIFVLYNILFKSTSYNSSKRS